MSLPTLRNMWDEISLAARLMLVSGVALTVLGLTYSAVVVRSEIDFHLADLRQNLNYEVDFLIPAIAEPAVVGDYALIQQLLAARVKQPSITQISWIDMQGNRIESRDSDVPAEAPAWFTEWLNFPRFEQSKEVIVGGEHYGKVELRLTSVPAANKVWQALQDKLEILLFGIGILFALTLTIVTNGLRPLYTLGAAARRFGQGEHSVRIPLSGPPEMSALVQVFNRMADNTENLLRSQRESNTKNRMLAVIVEQSNVAIITKDLHGVVTSWNSAASAVYGYSAEEMLGNTTGVLHLPGCEAEFEETLARIKSAGYSTLEARRIAKGGRILDVSLSVSPLHDEEGAHVGEISITRDITRQKQAEEALFKEKERAQVTLASIADAVITTDTLGRVEYLNPVAEQLMGWQSEQAYGHALPNIFHAVNEDTGTAIENPVEKVLNDRRTQGVRGDAVLISRSGVNFPIEHSAAAICNRDDDIIGAVLVFRDISASHNMARQLSWQASHDALTSLANRREFERRLDILVETAHCDGREHALLYMDLDQFKVVNDTCGHVAGDELLRQLSTLLNNRVRGSDTLARLGGDEFGVLLADCPLDKAMAVAETLRKTVSDFRFTWKDKTFVIGVSIGVVAIAGERQNNSDILGVADASCYLAKDKGRNRVQASPNDRELSERRGEMLWVARINGAFEENRFRLYYQPIVPIQQHAGSSKHYEVLLRMLDHQGNMVPPMAFIPAAERYNLMRAIDRRVVSMAFEECVNRTYHESPEQSVTISINISGDSLSDELFLDFLKQQFDEYQVQPQEICFEITETAAIANLTHAVNLIRELKEMGCRFSLDDFGSGLSSFGYLKNLPVDYLKIDGSFVRDMAQDPIDAAMVSAINDIGHVMGIQTIAEWVEDEQTLALLKKIGVDHAQGYLFDKPKPAHELILSDYPATRELRASI